MYKFILLSVLTIFSLTSCLKKTECSGYVYSKYNIPVAGISIKLLDYKSSRDESTSNVATTNGSGFYHFTFRTKRNHTYVVTCANDVDGGHPLNAAKTNVIDIKLNN
jgi:hypothetical protein